MRKTSWSSVWRFRGAAIHDRRQQRRVACEKLHVESLETRRLLYGDPLGGWDYLYDGVGDANGAGFTALDGTWSHFASSDKWDGTGPARGGRVASDR